MKPGSLVLVAVLLSLPTQSFGQQPSIGERASVRSAIDRGNAEYIAAFAKRDAEALANVYAPDGARLGRDGDYSFGHDAIAAEVRDFVGKVGSVAVTLETAALWIVNDQAYETGQWTYTFKAPGDSSKTIGGRYVTVWKRLPSSSWRILADMGVPGTQPPPPRLLSQQRDPEEAAIRQRLDDWLRALERGDMDALNEIIAPDYTITVSNGRVLNREQDLEPIRNGMRFTSAVVDSVVIRVLGLTAVVTGHGTYVGTQGGRSFTAHERFTDVWAKRQGRWQPVASSSIGLRAAKPDSSAATAGPPRKPS